VLIDDTIAAVSTPPGYGGIGIVRISGLYAQKIAEQLTQKIIQENRFVFSKLYDEHGLALDHGVVLFFKSPHSFTGEDVVELQVHGSPLVLERVLETVVFYGGRLAEPGEFSQRAFLHQKIDLVQAEAIADLIYAKSQQAAKAALSSLQGTFSKSIHQWTKELITLRVWVEALIDFSEEEIMSDQKSLGISIRALKTQMENLLKKAHEGVVLREGLKIALIGPPNVGKSSLLNYLTQKDSAIVSPLPGTTRDIVSEDIVIGGRHCRLFDTAGLRVTEDPIEQEGMKRAEHASEEADLVLLMTDWPSVGDFHHIARSFEEDCFQKSLNTEEGRCFLLINKMDLQSEESPNLSCKATSLAKKMRPVFPISLKSEEGLSALEEAIVQFGRHHPGEEGACTVRLRHLDALKQADVFLTRAILGLEKAFFEQTAEDLYCAQKAMESITGKTTSDDLLGKIFSEFCIGK
jgi:tRNA modification GTPase